MADSPFDKIFSSVKSGAGKAAQQMGLAAKIAKINMEISTQKSEKERHLKAIGLKTYAIFSKDGRLEANTWTEEISNELGLIQRIEKHLEDLSAEKAKLQSEFRSLGGQEVVDAADVKESGESRDESSDSSEV